MTETAALTWTRRADGRGYLGQPGDYRVCVERHYAVYRYAGTEAIEIGQAKSLAEAKAIAEAAAEADNANAQRLSRADADLIDRYIVRERPFQDSD
jgi:hypothetical protein